MSHTGHRSGAKRKSFAGRSGSRHAAPRRVTRGRYEFLIQGLPRTVLRDLYHHFMTVGWPRLFITLAGFFLGFDLLFGLLYYLAPGCIANLNPPGFAGAFFFSVETFATVGYGDMHPQTLYGHLIAMAEIFAGLMSLALITGIMFARFSRPRARFLFTRNAVVRPIDGKATFVVRAANERQNVVQDASAQLRLLYDDTTVEGMSMRRIVELPLVRSQHPMFSLGWTIMHVIDDTSPLRGETAQSLREKDASIILSVSGTDDTTGQVLSARTEYTSGDIHWNAAFPDLLEEAADGTLNVDYRRFDQVVPLAQADEPPRRGD
ncbi:MAG: ion channel [Steroidobacteraceae bacterium]